MRHAWQSWEETPHGPRHRRRSRRIPQAEPQAAGSKRDRRQRQQQEEEQAQERRRERHPLSPPPRGGQGQHPTTLRQRRCLRAKHPTPPRHTPTGSPSRQSPGRASACRARKRSWQCRSGNGTASRDCTGTGRAVSPGGNPRAITRPPRHITRPKHSLASSRSRHGVLTRCGQRSRCISSQIPRPRLAATAAAAVTAAAVAGVQGLFLEESHEGGAPGEARGEDGAARGFQAGHARPGSQ
jgi:hypothetical protein